MKKTLFIYFLLASNLFSMEHNFYFSNDIVLKHSNTLNNIIHENPLLIDKKNIYNKIKINLTITNSKKVLEENVVFDPITHIIDLIFGLETDLETKSSNLKINSLIKDKQYYILNIDEKNIDNSFNIVKVDPSQSIESYIENKFNIILKPDISKGIIYVLNKKLGKTIKLSFENSLIMNINNKKIILKYEKTNQFL